MMRGLHRRNDCPTARPIGSSDFFLFKQGENKMKTDLFKTNGSSPPATVQPQPTVGPQHDEVWSVADVAKHLKMSPRQVWELTRQRGQLRSDHPIPHIKIHRKALRFRKSDVQEGLAKLAEEARGQ